MILYNFLLSTRIGAKLVSDPNNKGVFKTLRGVGMFLEVALLLLLTQMISDWAISSGINMLAIVAVVFVLAAYALMRFTFGSEKHADYLELRAALGLGPGDKSLFDKDLDTSSLIDDLENFANDVFSEDGEEDSDDEDPKQLESLKSGSGEPDADAEDGDTDSDSEDDSWEEHFGITEETIEKWRKEFGE